MFEGLDEESTLNFLEVAHLYGFENVQKALFQQLESVLSLRNVCRLLDRILLLKLECLTEVCRRSMESVRGAVKIPAIHQPQQSAEY